MWKDRDIVALKFFKTHVKIVAIPLKFLRKDHDIVALNLFSSSTTAFPPSSNTTLCLTPSSLYYPTIHSFLLLYTRLCCWLCTQDCAASYVVCCRQSVSAAISYQAVACVGRGSSV